MTIVLWSVLVLLRRVLKTVIVVAIVITLVPAAMIGTALAIVLFTPVPVTIPAAKTKPAILPSEVYDANGNLLAVFRTVDLNVEVDPKDIPLVLRQAIVASEDRRFYTHTGVDPIGLVRALRRDLQQGEAEQGASTITQQLVKAVYYPEDDPKADPFRSDFRKQLDRLSRKIRIAVIANRLDREMDKDTILEQYLSNIFLGNGAFGVGAASRAYFRKDVKDLTISEAATIAGIIPAPSKYEPRGNTRNAEFKRKVTLAQMRRESYITIDEYNEALAQELWVDPGDGSLPQAGQPVTVVYGPTQVDTAYPYFMDYVRRYLLAKYGDAAVYGGGLRVQTTIDPRLQKLAEKAAADALKGTNSKLEMAIVSVEPLTGFVKAIVGGRDWGADQVNLGLGNCPDLSALRERLDRDLKLDPACTALDGIDGGGSGRSPGSSFKPIVLAAAFQQGIPPTQVIEGSPYRDPRCTKTQRNCTVIRNYEGAAYGPVDLRTATIKSVNTSYARLGYDLVGIENVVKMAQKLGIRSAWYDPATQGPSYSLGGLDVSPLEMAAAYSVFAGRGKRAPVTPVLLVTDSKGTVLEDNLARLPEQVITEAVADNVTAILQATVSEGTGKRASLGERPVAGKTGTSQDYGNAWFVGYTPTLSTAVWLGYKDRPRQLRNIGGFGAVAGGTVPARTFARYMKEALENTPITDFLEPAPIVRPVRRSAKELKQYRQRGGIDAGARRSRVDTPIPSFIESGSGPSPISPALDPDPVPATVPPTVPPIASDPALTVPVPAGDAVAATVPAIVGSETGAPTTAVLTPDAAPG